MTAEVRYATGDDIAEYYGHPLPQTVRAFAGIVNGRVAAIGGLIYQPTGQVYAFLDMRPEARAYPKLFLRTARRVMKEFAFPGMTVLADANEPRSIRTMLSLGFKLVAVDTTGALMVYTGDK